MAITWTKEWSAADDGTIFTGADLKNIQDDISSGVGGNATEIQSVPVDAPVTGDDQSLLFYDDPNNKFDYVARSAVMTGESITGLANLGMTTVTDITDILDEDDMVSDSATALATQQSIKAFIDANTVGREEFTSSGSFTGTAGITKVWVTQVGGGGGGGGASAGGSAGGGGGGGAETRVTFPVTISDGETITVTLGAAGTAGVGGNPSVSNGGDGGDTTFAAASGTITAAGGKGGLQQTAGGTGGLGGGASLDGINGPAGAGIGGGAGIVGGTGGDTGGGGGGTLYGVGGTGGNSGSAPNDASGFGAGGGAGDGSQGHGSVGTIGYLLVQW